MSAVIVVPVAAYRWYVDSEGQRLRDAAVARIEATDPRWRWEDIEADLPVLRDEDNASLLVAEFRKTVGVECFFQIDFRPERDAIHRGNEVSHNHLPTDSAYSLIDKELVGTDLAWPVVTRLAATPRGRRTLLPAGTWKERRPPDEERVEPVLNYLKCEAERQSRTNQFDRAETVARAYLNVARIEAVHPYTGGYLGRLNRLQEAARLVERLLAVDGLGDRLPRLQAEFAAEAEVELFRPAVLLTRAEYDNLFRAFAAQEASLAEHLKGRSENVPVRERAEVWQYRPHAAADWAAALNFATDVLAVAELPDPARPGAFAAIPTPPADDRHPFSLGCARILKVSLHSSLRTRALLRCTEAALATERYRRLMGDWPTSLEVIPKAILRVVPSDPFTGDPLCFVRTPEGVTITSVEPKTAFLLYDPSQRRLPPLPPWDDR